MMRRGGIRGLFVTAVLVGAMYGPSARAQNQSTSSLTNELASAYLGDAADDSVKRINAYTGQFVDTIVSSGNGGLHGPRGMIFDHLNRLLVVNQNVNLPLSGSVLMYNPSNGAFLGELVKASDPNAPNVPVGGIVLGLDNHLYVTDFYSNPTSPDGAPGPGRVAVYDGFTGAFQYDLDASSLPSKGYPLDGYHPRGMVFGLDGLLYVSVRFLGPTGGAVLRFNTFTKKLVDVFAQSDATNDLNRPDGLVFGSDNALYVTSFQSPAGTDTDKVIVFDGPFGHHPGAYVKKIDLDSPAPAARTYAQAILFGPGGGLYVPIAGNDPVHTGELRRYDVAKGNFTIVRHPNPLKQPYYFSFRLTDPTFLRYWGP